LRKRHSQRHAVVPKAIRKFTDAGIDALFIPFCDFGEESVAAGIAAGFQLPTLVWGPRDEVPNTDAARGRDTQCGMFAATKVMRNHGVKFSYICNVATEAPAFLNGFLNFIRTTAIIRDLRACASENRRTSGSVFKRYVQ
jgi:hypothetical protein